MLKILGSILKKRVLLSRSTSPTDQLVNPAKGLEVIPSMSLSNTTMLLYLKRIFDKISPLEGSIVECGLGAGTSFLMLSHIVREELKGRKLWGFDSFEGFPKPAIQDLSPRNLQQGEFNIHTVETLRKLLIESGLDVHFVTSQITLIKGFFEESLSKYQGGPIALLHLDVDIYQSYLTTLNELYPKVVPGGVVLFDEYLGTLEHYRFPGAKKAIDEFFGAKAPQIQRDPLYGKYFLIKEN